jgi:hypothetical protein
VNTVVLFDVPRRPARRRFEALLRAHGFVWLFPSARWSSKSLAGHDRLVRLTRSRLAGETYRVVFLEIPERSRLEARWLSAAPTEAR